jgi:hypothetical protein
MALSGMAAGANDALQEMLLRAFQQKQQEEQMALQQQAAERADAGQRLQSRQFEADQEYRQGQVARQAQQDDIAAADRRRALNKEGVKTQTIEWLKPRVQAGQINPQDRMTAVLQAAGEGVELPDQITSDPGQPQRERIELENLRNRNELQQIAAAGQYRAAASPELEESRRLRNESERAKQADVQKTRDNALNNMRSYGDDMLAVIGELIDEQGNLKPEAAGVIGTFEGAVPEGVMFDDKRQKALAAIKRLNSNLSIETLQRLKEQSRTGATGFGALTEKELAVVENARSTLGNRRQSEGSYGGELKRIRDEITRTRGARGAAAPPPAGKTMTRAQLQAIAQKHGMSEADALTQAVAQGYTVQ